VDFAGPTGYYADPALAQQQFGCQAHRSLAEM